MIEQIKPGMWIESKRTGVKYYVVGMDMGFVACIRQGRENSGEQCRYSIPYVRNNFQPAGI